MERQFIELALAEAGAARAAGNLPYGCVLVDDKGAVLLTGQNTLMTSGDCLAHAEINLIREASMKYTRDELQRCTIYTSDEPCPMCAGAIFWSGIGRLAYAISKQAYYDFVGRDDPEYYLEIPCRQILESGSRVVVVDGPFCDERVADIHGE